MIKITRGKKYITEIIVGKEKLKHETNIKTALYNYGNDITGELEKIIKSGKRTGRVYIIRGRQHQASAPGEPPANLTGRLAEGFKYKVSGVKEMVVYTNVKSNKGFNYPRYLEEDLNRPYFDITNKQNAYKLERDLMRL